MLVPVLLQRSEKQHEVEKEQQFQYLSSPSPPSSARIDSLSSRLLAEVTAEVELGTKLVAPGAAGHPDALPLEGVTRLLVV